MRQHVNPLSKNFFEIDPIPSLNEIFANPRSPLHLDIGCASGDFLFELSLTNKNWNYIGIEIREKLVQNANLKMKDREHKNLYFSFGNANNFFEGSKNKTLIDSINSISINFLSDSMKKRSLIFIKTDVKELFEYMELTISESIKFKKLANEDFRFNESFNPNKIQTKREKYVLLNKIAVYESIYMKI